MTNPNPKEPGQSRLVNPASITFPTIPYAGLMYRTPLLLALCLVTASAFWACDSGKEEVSAAEKAVFAVHDEIMPKVMGDLVTLKKQLKQRVLTLDSLKSNGSAAATLRLDEEKEQAARLSQNLSNADSLMTVWMAQYNGDTLEKLPTSDALNYLNAQKDKISDVKTKVNASIEQARQFLGKQ